MIRTQAIEILAEQKRFIQSVLTAEVAENPFAPDHVGGAYGALPNPIAGGKNLSRLGPSEARSRSTTAVFSVGIGGALPFRLSVRLSGKVRISSYCVLACPPQQCNI